MARLPIDKARLIGPGSGALVRYIKFVHRTSRVVFDPPDAQAKFSSFHPMIFALWHGQFMMVPALCPPDVKVRIMVARHGDAELIGGVLTRFGMDLIRGAGASGRKKDRGGARALLAAKAALEEGHSVGMTADVPPGPARRAGLGIVTLAKISGKPIMPVAVASSRFKALDTWSRMTIALPWSTIGAVVGDPIYIARDADDAALEAGRLEVERAMREVTARAYRICGGDPTRAMPDGADEDAPPSSPGPRLALYRHLMGAAEPLVPAILSWREKRGKESAERRGERLGRASVPRADGVWVWMHAASVGELNAALPLMSGLRAQRADLRFLVTTGTLTSAKLAASRITERDVHQFVPLDSPRFVARFLDHWRPDIAIFTESEIWPNLIIGAADRGIPLALVNARMSPRSFGRWSKRRGVSRPLFNRFAAVLAQTEKLSRWFRELGARNSITAGNLKVDAPPPPVDQSALTALREVLGDRPRLVVASTHAPEEDVVAEAHLELAARYPTFCTIIAPRHPERGAAIAQMLEAKGVRTVLRSTGALPDATTGVYVADTIGELGTLFRLSPLAFLGKSLDIGPGTTGGQNPIEAIRHSAGVITGPSVANFQEVYDTLIRAGGTVVARSSNEIAAAVDRLLADDKALDELKSNADAALRRLSGAMSITIETLLPLLPAAADTSRTSAEQGVGSAGR